MENKETLQIGAVMTRDVWTCAAHDTLDHAARLMWERDCGALPVVDRDHRVVGMITDRDVCMAAYTKGKVLSHVHVSDAMARYVHTVRISDDVLHAEHAMSEFQVRRLPVIDGTGRLVGLVSLVDLARRNRHPDHESTDGVARTLAAIGAPHGIASGMDARAC